MPWKGIEKEDARERQTLAGGDKVSVFAPALPDNCPEALNKGDSRDKLAERVGFGSGKTYERANMLGWHVSKVKKYSALSQIYKEVWDIIVPTFEDSIIVSPDEDGTEKVPNGTIFAEG